MPVKTLVDSGCKQSVVSSNAVSRLQLKITGPGKTVKMLNGNTTHCSGEVQLQAAVGGRNIKLKCLIALVLVWMWLYSGCRWNM